MKSYVTRQMIEDDKGHYTEEALVYHPSIEDALFHITKLVENDAPQRSAWELYKKVPLQVLRSVQVDIKYGKKKGRKKNGHKNKE